MAIEMRRDHERMTVRLEGALDADAALQLEKAVENDLETIHLLVLDASSLTSISAEGLRVFFRLHQRMEKQGSVMMIRGANEEIQKTFAMAGVPDLFDNFFQ